MNVNFCSFGRSQRKLNFQTKEVNHYALIVALHVGRSMAKLRVYEIIHLKKYIGRLTLH
jgi:hypothetical protein